MSIVDSLKISNKRGNKNIFEDKKCFKKQKNKFIFNTIVNMDKYASHKNKKISKSKSSSVILTKKKNTEIKKQILIPTNLKGPPIKTNNAKKKITYNNSTSELIDDRYHYLVINRINNKEYHNKRKKNSQYNTVNYIANNINLSSNKKDNKFQEIKGINSIASLNNNNNINSNCNKNNNNNNSLKYDELKKTNEKLNLLLNEKLRDNKKFKNKVNYLENKNEQILKKIEKIKKENDKSAQILEKVIKLLQILKTNGLDVEELLENISYSEDDDDLENNTYSDDFSSINSKQSKKNSGINSEKSHFKSEGESIIYSDNKNHKLYKGNKAYLKDVSIPKLDMKKIYNNNEKNIKKFGSYNTHKHKNYSHSVGQ